MTEAPKTTRVAHFIAAYDPLDEKTQKLIWDRVHRGGWGPDDPMSLQIAHDTIMEARMEANLAAATRLPDRITKATDASISAVQKSQAQERTAYARNIAHQIAKETRSSLVESMPRLEAQLARRARSRRALTWALGVFSILLVAAFIGLSGFVMGRVTTADLDLQFAEQATRPDADTWLDLLRENGNLDDLIADHCGPGRAGHISDPSGRAACRLPLWLDDIEAPVSRGVFARAKGFLVSAWAKLSYEGLAIIALVLGVFGITIYGGIKAWMRSDDEGS